MRITTFDIDGFGVWTDLRLDELSPGLNVFYGPNEAGKTTLMQFVRTIFYGFSPERRLRYLPPVHGGDPGGALELAGDEGAIRVARHDDRDRSRSGSVLVSLAEGSTADPQAVNRLLGAIDEAVYNNVFAVGLREIQELGTLSDTDAAEFLYKFSAGLDRVSLVEVLRALRAERERILGDDAVAGQLEPLVDEHAALGRQIEALTDLSHQYAGLVGQRRNLAREAEASEAEAAQLERSARLIELATTLHGKWNERQSALAELASHAHPPRVGESDVARLDAANAGRRAVRKNLRRLRASRGKLLAEIASLGLNERLWRQAPRIEALLEQEAWIGSLETRSRALVAELAALEEEWRAAHQRLGIDRPLPIDGETPLSTEPPRELARLSRALHRARAAVDETEAKFQAGQKASAAAVSSIDATLAGRQRQQLVAQLESSGALVSQLRRRVQLDQRLAEMARQEVELRTAARELVDRQLLPPRVLVGLGGAFVVGAVFLLGGLFLPASIVGSLGWGMAGLGALASGGAAAAKILLERSAKRQLETCQRQLETLEDQADQAKQERDDLDARLPAGGGPLLARLQAAEKEHAALEQLLPLDAQKQQAQQDVQSIEQLRDEAQAEYRARRRRWREALASAGLPENLTPREVRSWLHGRRELADLRSRVRAKRQELEQRRAEFAAVASRVSQLLAELGLVPTSDQAGEQLKQLRDELRSQTALASRRDALHEQLRLRRKRRRELDRLLARWQRRRRRVLRAAGTRDEAELRRRAQEAGRYEILLRQRDALSAEIAAALGAHHGEDQLAATLAGRTAADLEAQWEELAARSSALRDRIKSAHEQIGRHDAQLEALATDRRPAELRLRQGQVETRIQELVGRWRVLAATESLLDAVRRTYEAERQPETLREASRYLQKLTDGHYTRVWTPLEANVLRVDDATGESLPVEVLSRGTREQLFLSLRLALVSAYARRGIELPLVLDDVLVNFDARRAKLAVAVLREFAAQGRQTLVFTCHEHVFRLFKAQKVWARELPSHDPATRVVAPLPPIIEEPEPTLLPAAPLVGATAGLPSSAEVPAEPPPLSITPIEIPGPTTIIEPVFVAPRLADPPIEEEPAVVAPVHVDLPPPPGTGDDEEEIEVIPDIRPRRERIAVARVGRRAGPFERSIWHEPVLGDFDGEAEASHRNGHGLGPAHWSEITDDRDSPDDQEAA